MPSPAIEYVRVPPKFCDDSSSRFYFGSRIHTETQSYRYATDHPIHASAITGVGNKHANYRVHNRGKEIGWLCVCVPGRKFWNKMS